MSKSNNNVFMIGWEYPPHNSGGLGVACKGLTKALSDEKVSIDFSLPYNLDHDVDHMNILSCVHPNWEEANNNPLYQPPFSAYSQEFNTDKVPTNSGYSFDISKLRKLPTTQLEKQVNEYAKVVGQQGKKSKFDVIHAHDWMSFPAAQELKKKTGKPFVAHVHSTEYDRAGLNFGNKYIAGVEFDAMNIADQIIAVSYYTKSLLVYKYGIDAKKISVVHNGVAALQVPAQPGSQHFAQKRPVIVFMGRLTLHKGVTYFIDLAQEVLKTIPDALFVVAGAGDMYHELLFRTAGKNLSASIVFTGFVRDKQRRKLLNRADVFVMPSISEPFGLVAMEAAQRHTPVIVSKNSGVGEVLEGAHIIDFWDIKKMSATIKKLVSDDDYAQTVVTQQLKSVKKQNWKASARKVKAIYRKMFLG